MTKLKPLSENSWLLSSNGINIGVLSKTQVGNYNLLIKGANSIFKNKEEISEFFKEDIFASIPEKSESSVITEINGYPTNSELVIIATSSDGLPLFYKNQTKNVLFSAGWYCLDFPKGWQPALCPKLSTLQTHGYQGPYKTESEMRLFLKNLKSS